MGTYGKYGPLWSISSTPPKGSYINKHIDPSYRSARIGANGKLARYFIGVPDLAPVFNSSLSLSYFSLGVVTSYLADTKVTYE